MPRDGRVECEVKFKGVPNEKNRLQDGVEVTCGKCGYAQRAFGEGPKSIKRCLVLLRENCPEGEENFYVVDEEYLEDEDEE